MIYLPFTADYTTEIFISVAGDRRVITRTCDNGTWNTDYKDIIQSSDNGEIILERLNSKRFTRIASWDESDKRSLVSLDIVDPNNNYNTMRLQFDNETGDIYKFFYNGADQTWVFKSKYCQTTVADIPLTTITTFNAEGLSGTVIYQVKNGICYVWLWPLMCTRSSMYMNVCSVPKPIQDSGCNVIDINTGTAIGFVFANADGPLYYHSYQANTYGYGSFSYPVAES